ncbi:lysozyme inhibitor LprI family protein [Hoeflea sp. TYP-13]
MRTMATVLFLAAASPVPAQALNCDGTTPEMNQCVFEAYDAADRELNRVWKEVLSKIKPDDYLPADDARQWKEHLIAAQRAWVTFKEEDCQGAVSYEYFGGTGATFAVGYCLYAHTVARTNNLKERYLER